MLKTDIKKSPGKRTEKLLAQKCTHTKDSTRKDQEKFCRKKSNPIIDHRLNGPKILRGEFCGVCSWFGGFCYRWGAFQIWKTLLAWDWQTVPQKQYNFNANLTFLKRGWWESDVQWYFGRQLWIFWCGEGIGDAELDFSRSKRVDIATFQHDLEDFIWLTVFRLGIDFDMLSQNIFWKTFLSWPSHPKTWSS